MERRNIKGIRLLDNINEVGIFEKLPPFQDIRIEARPTDFALLTGGVKDKFGLTPYWTRTTGWNSQACITSTEYTLDLHYFASKTAKSPGIRPVLEFDKVPNKKTILFGEYPQTAEYNPRIIEQLNKFKNNNSKNHLTGKTYCFDNENLTEEYEFEGNKYVPIKCKSSDQILSDGRKTQLNKVYWVKVEPVHWYVDTKNKLLISEFALVSGIHYWKNVQDMDYDDSNMKPFLEDRMLDNICTIGSKENAPIVDTYPEHRDMYRGYEKKAKHVVSVVIDNNQSGEQFIDAQIVKILKNLKYSLSNNDLSEEDKKIITEVINRKKQLDKLPISDFKTSLNMVLYYDLIDLDIKVCGLDNDYQRYESFKSKLKELFKSLELKRTNVDLSPIKGFLNQISIKIDKIYNKRTKNRFDKNNWRKFELILDKIVDGLVLDDTGLRKVTSEFDLHNLSLVSDLMISLLETEAASSKK